MYAADGVSEGNMENSRAAVESTKDPSGSSDSDEEAVPADGQIDFDSSDFEVSDDEEDDFRSTRGDDKDDQVDHQATEANNNNEFHKETDMSTLKVVAISGATHDSTNTDDPTPVVDDDYDQVDDENAVIVNFLGKSTELVGPSTNTGSSRFLVLSTPRI